MWIIAGSALLIIPCVITDLKWKKIPFVYCLAVGAAGAALHLIVKDLTLAEMIAGVGFGCFFIGVSAVTKGKIGMGDSLLITASGAAAGIGLLLPGTLAALLLSCLYGLLALLIRKRKDEIPFAPFFAAGMLAAIILKEVFE